MNKKIEDLTEVELKALAFEHTIQVEHSQGAIVTIKNELLRRQQEGAVKESPLETVAKKK